MHILLHPRILILNNMSQGISKEKCIICDKGEVGRSPRKRFDIGICQTKPECRRLYKRAYRMRTKQRSDKTNKGYFIAVHQIDKLECPPNKRADFKRNFESIRRIVDFWTRRQGYNPSADHIGRALLFSKKTIKQHLKLMRELAQKQEQKS